MVSFGTATLLPALVILLGMFGCLELGRWCGVRRRALGGDPADGGPVDGAIFALFGLLIAFTFSGAADRFERRRGQIVAEANAVGTAWLRLDLLPAEAQAELRPLFREYLRSRLATYALLPDLEAAQAEYARSGALQARIWSVAVPAARGTRDPGVETLVTQSLNDMFDIATTRVSMARQHVPGPVLALLFALGLASALVVGYAAGARPERPWFRPLVFALVIAATVFIILDLEYPRFGLVRVDDMDRVLEDVLRQMQ